jgi:hypothetical protein
VNGALALLLAACGDTVVVAPDADGDGYLSVADCDDGLAEVNPSAAEACDGLDNDCDGLTDEDPLDPPPWYPDVDQDGYGVWAQGVLACAPPADHIATPGDCDDQDPAVHPIAVEVCDAVDNDCDGVTDEEDAADAVVFYGDVDLDGYGDPAEPSVACARPAGFAANDQDCDGW